MPARDMKPPVPGCPPRRSTILIGLLALLGGSACQSLPPAITGITIFPVDAAGQPHGDELCRTQVGAPIPVIGVRPGADPQLSARFLNEPVSGRIAITLARGVQHFLLYTAWVDPGDRLGIAIYLDHVTTPALACVVAAKNEPPMQAAAAATVIGMDGEPVASHAALSVVRGGYRVTLRQAVFPLPVHGIDTLGPWSLQPDSLADSVGVITLDVTPVR